MTVYMLAYSRWRGSGGIRVNYAHPAYRKLADTWDVKTISFRDRLSLVLTEFQGRIDQFGSSQVMFEFDTQEDFTAFVLAWS